jgi:hypothetical protein
MHELGRRAARVAAAGLLGLGVLGMGALGGGGRDTGLPPKDFKVALTDVDGTRVEVTHATVGGDTSLEGDLGRGRLRVPFDGITHIRLEPTKEDHDRVKAEIALREGQPVTLTLRSATTFYGQTPSGAFQIRARDLRAVDFAQQ